MSEDDLTRAVQAFAVEELTLHPAHEIFAAVDPYEIKQLAVSIERDGLHHWIEVTADGVVLAGRKRLAAIQLLRWPAVECLVRNDLTDAEAIERFLIADNLIRHNLLPSEKARAMQRYVELMRGSLAVHQGEFRDLAGQKFGVTGRTLDRHLRLLKTPREVQDAVDGGLLGLVQANKIAGLRVEDQVDFADALRAGADAAQVFLQYFPGKPMRKPTGQTPAGGDSALRAAACCVGELVRAASSGKLASTPANSKLLATLITRLQQVRSSLTPKAD